ncbi:mercury methylation corrinoid protein HgcA [Spirochaetota bacterium]
MSTTEQNKGENSCGCSPEPEQKKKESSCGCSPVKEKKIEESGCGCSSESRLLSMDDLIGGNAVKKPVVDEREWVTGKINTAEGQVSIVSAELSKKERREHIKARLFNSFRMDYSVEPGLYAAGSPDENSDVFVSANYKLSFDKLRVALKGINAWIIVLDTKGINVWCAAGKGTFGTDELTGRIIGTGISKLVDHRRIILPQLGAVGVNAKAVKNNTSFRVYYGPVLAEDIKKYAENNYKATDDMRLVKFPMLERLVLTPMEINPAMKKFPLLALVILLIFGLQGSGVIFKDAFFGGWTFVGALFLSILSGALLTPLFLPFIPFRSFSLKGWIMGAIVIGAYSFIPGVIDFNNISLLVSLYLFFPLLSSYIAVQFTGSTTYTSPSGVNRELKFGIPLYITGTVISVLFLVYYKLVQWSII